MRDERVEVACAIRDEAELEPVGAKLVEHGQGVFVEVEVLRALPRQLDLHGALAGPFRVTAHAAEDALCERVPDLFIVDELGMPLKSLERARSRLLVQLRVELHAVAARRPDVAVGSELWAGPREREV